MPNPFRAIAWWYVKRWVHQEFPTVQSLSTEALDDWLMSDRPSPILIDARQKTEYQVSHLPGARHLPTVEVIQQAELPLDSAIVLYCSIGYRSARIAQKLEALGYQNVFNLYQLEMRVSTIEPSRMRLVAAHRE